MHFVRDRKFFIVLISIGLPIVLQQLITTGVNMADNIMLGSLGETPMSGATLANQFIGLFQICCMGIGMGASVLTSRFWGMRDITSLKKAIVIMLRICVLFSLIFTIVTFVAPVGILHIFTNEEAVIEQGRRYFEISVYTYILTGLSMTISIVLRSVGRANVPLYASIVAFVSNLFFNWVFIYGKLGFPKLGVRGAALGTLLARVFECTVILGFLFWKENHIRLKVSDLLMPCGDLVMEYIRICIPVLISDSLLGIGNSAISVVTGHIGASFVAAASIATVVQQFSTVIIQGMSQASCIMTGNTLGEGKVERAKGQANTFVLIGAIVGLLGALIITAIKGQIISFYNVTDETKLLANELMSSVAVIVVFQCMNSILTKGVLRGGGDTRFLMVADILFLWCESIPLGALAGLVWHLSGFWIYFLLKSDQVIKAVWCLFRLHNGKWIKKISSNMEIQSEEKIL